MSQCGGTTRQRWSALSRSAAHSGTTCARRGGWTSGGLQRAPAAAARARTQSRARTTGMPAVNGPRSPVSAATVPSLNVGTISMSSSSACEARERRGVRRLAASGARAGEENETRAHQEAQLLADECDVASSHCRLRAAASANVKCAPILAAHSRGAATATGTAKQLPKSKNRASFFGSLHVYHILAVRSLACPHTYF